MNRCVQRLIILILMIAMPFTVTACGKNKKAAKPKAQKTAEVKNGTTKAGGKGSNASDVPLRISCSAMENKFNPFTATAGADIQVVDMTQVRLLETDRAGQIVMNGIDGELREFNGENYTYYGIANVKIHYDRQAGYSVYRITLRDDLHFSDGEALTIDDVIFSLYAFCDKSYKGPITIGRSNIQGLTAYRKGREKMISGIKRLGDYELKIYTDGYDQKMLEKLRIPVCPLHYYGDKSKYHYEAGQFGLERGNVSSLCANQTSPLGAGPYRFVKFEGNIAYYTANELYYKGCPKTAFLYLEDMGKLMSTGMEDGTGLISEIAGDTVDVAWMLPTPESLETVMNTNGNGKLQGKTLETRSIAGDNYGYVCLNAEQIKVGTDIFSEQSCLLRRALATVISACRGAEPEQYENAICLTDYPASVDSWLSGEQWEDSRNPYALDANGKVIYKEDDKLEKKREAAKKAALEYLKAAGYTMAAEGNTTEADTTETDTAEGGNRISAAPVGAALQYSVWIQGGEDNPMYSSMSAAAEDLQELGITLHLINVTDAGTMQEQLKSGKQQIWCSVETVTADPDLEKKYGAASSAKEDEFNKGQLTGMAKNQDLQKALYKLGQRINAEKQVEWTDRIYQMIFSQAVEVPVYQTRQLMVLSARHVDVDTLTKDVTPYYSLTREIERIEMTGK